MADLRHATADEVKSLVKDFIKDKYSTDGKVDTEKLAAMDEDALSQELENYTSSKLADGSLPDVYAKNLIERADNAVSSIQNNAENYNSDKAKAEFEARATGSSPEIPSFNIDSGTIVVDYEDTPDEGESGSSTDPSNPSTGDDENPDEENPEDPDDDDDDSAGDDDEFNDSEWKGQVGETPAGTNPGARPGSTATTSSASNPGADEFGEEVDGDNAAVFKTVKDTSLDWNRMAYGVALCVNYRDYRTALKKHLTTLIEEAESGESAESLMSKAETSTEGITGTSGYTLTNPVMYRSPSVSDASVGGNDAINPYSAFNLDDDLVHDISYSSGHTYGMGRCYGEMYESKQQILYMTMGIPKFRNLRIWLQNAVNKEMSEMNDIGAPKVNLGKLLSDGLSLAIALPWLPIKWAANIITSIKDYKVTEYFYFRDNMPLYYRYWNSLLSEIAVGMGLYGLPDDDAGGNGTGTNQSTGDANKGQPSNGANISSSQRAKYMQALPAIMQEGPDIFKIMSRRARRMSSGATATDTDALVNSSKQRLITELNENKDKGETGWKEAISSALGNFWTGLTAGALEGMNFVGFRIEKSDNANESFSNSTADSPLLATLNNEVAQNREQAYGASTGGTGALENIKRIAKQVTRLKNNVINLTKQDFDKTIAYVASGNGYFDLPKQWSGSAGMSRSLSFNMKLRAKTGGDNVSIFQSIMIPLSGLMAAALPRAVGDTTYTSPFLVRAFCKGMFAVPAGIISSLSITRGSSEFGWSLSKLPTVVDVSFTIEDLSPMLFLSIAGGAGVFDAIGQAFANNTKMHEYINTLVGIGAKERYYLLGQLKRRFKTALLISKNTTFSATYRGYVMGDSSIVRSLMALTPYTWVKNN